jgi:Fic family protein
MSQGKRTKVTDATLAAIIAEIHKRAEKAPPGFFPLEHWENRWGCKRSAVKKYLNAGVTMGILERITLRHSYDGKYVRRAPYYGPASKKAGQKPKR